MFRLTLFQRFIEAAKLPRDDRLGDAELQKVEICVGTLSELQCSDL